MADGVLQLQNVRVIDERIDNIDKVIDITLTASGWLGGSAPYTQTINNANITSKSNPKLYSTISSSMTAAQQEAYLNAWNCVVQGNGVTTDGAITFYVWEKPNTDIVVRLKGV